MLDLTLMKLILIVLVKHKVMKANEAPEKIYLLKSQDRILDGWYNKQPIPKTFEQVEYIRTDAFIEKACVKLKKLMYDNLMFQGRLHQEKIIENFVGDFRKYMKGE